MPTILNIESSCGGCSVALSVDGAVEFSAEERKPMMQATLLAPYAARALEEIERKGLTLDAVAVTAGPGSYTGLRIGMSLAKGLAYANDVPLILVNTLKLLAVKAMFRGFDWTGEEILMPMIDARRMEVYTAAYNFRLDDILAPQSMIVTADSLSRLPGDSIWIMGDGAAKTKDVIKDPRAHWIDGLVPSAKDMTALAEKQFRENDFADLAYSVPLYVKEYTAIVGDNPLKHLIELHNTQK